MKADLSIPSRIRRLPKDERGYPIPFFVAYYEGKPDFRVADPKKWLACVKEKRCWVCGDILGQYMAFVIGPMCALNRNTAEPPSHLDCARFSVQACPFLTRPKQLRLPQEHLPEGTCRPGGIAIDRNPGVSLIWVTRDCVVYSAGNGPCIRVGEPTSIEFWREGRRATQAEVRESIETGMPILRQYAEQEGEEAMRDLQEKQDNFEREWVGRWT